MAKNCEINFRSTVIEQTLLAEGDRVIIAVSGGVDSMVLLDLLARLRNSMKIDLSVAHVNYGLRGAESDRDEDLVRERSERYGIPCYVLHARLSNADNLQNEARRARYDFLKECAKERNVNVVAMAHHRDDQAETILMHLMRGAGLQGLCGMPFANELAQGLRLIRPLLHIGRDRIAAYAAERRVRFAEDATNAETRYSRNAVRHTLLPAMEEFNPQIRDHLSNMAGRLREDEGALMGLATSFCSEHMTVPEGSDLRVTGHGSRVTREVDLPRTAFIQLQPAVRRRVLMTAYEKLTGSRVGLNSDQLRRMDEIAQSAANEGEYLLPGAYRYERNYNRLRMLPPA